MGRLAGALGEGGHARLGWQDRRANSTFVEHLVGWQGHAGAEGHRSVQCVYSLLVNDVVLTMSVHVVLAFTTRAYNVFTGNLASVSCRPFALPPARREEPP